MTSLLRLASLGAALALLAACGSGAAPSYVQSMPVTSNVPPASLGAITPGPGIATLVPSSTTYVAGTPLPSATGFATLAPATPAPAPTGSDLAALVAGRSPSAAYFASLSAAQSDAIVALGTTGAPRGVIGTILGFSSDGFTVKTATNDLSSVVAAGAAYAAETDAAGASEIVAHVSSDTLDLVPGGYGALRIGMAVILTGSGMPANFTATTVIANPKYVSAGTSSSNRRLPDRMPVDRFLAEANGGSRAKDTNKPRVRHRDDGTQNQTAFALTRTQGFPGGTIPDPPLNAPFASLGCSTINFTVFITYGLGLTANYPMELEDTSDPSTYLEGQVEPLPVQLATADSGGMRTYFVNTGVAENVGITQDFSACHLAKGKPTSYTFGLVTIGQALEADSTAPLPATGATAMVTHNSCPFISFPLSPLTLVINTPTPSINFCFDQMLTGATIYGSATITNATLVSVPNANGMTETSWTYQTDLPSGNANVTLIPNASPTDGSMQENVMSLSGMSTDLKAQALPMLMICSFANLCITPTNGVMYQVPSAFELRENIPVVGLEKPSPVTLTLMPSDGEVPITVK